MFIFLLAISFGGAVASDGCWFLWDNTTGAESNIDVSSISNPVTGLITVDGTVIIPAADIKTEVVNNISFQKGGTATPLELTFYMNKDRTQKINVNGSESQQDSPDTFISDTFQDGKINLQVSDIDATADKNYKIFPFKNTTATQCNFGSEAEWKRITDKATIDETDLVKNTTTPDDQLHIFTYISVCSAGMVVPTVELSPIPKLELGNNYNITCTGSGAPYLSIKWEYEPADQGLVTDGPVAYNDTAPKHAITSNLTISNFSEKHVKSYKCSVSNDNLGNQRSASFYAAQFSVSIVSDTFYSPDTGDIILLWSFTGWPFATFNLTVSCTPSADSIIHTDHDNNATRVYQITFKNGTKDDKLTCTSKNVTAVVNTATVFRVGWNCTVGEYGVNNTCPVCGEGNTSLATATTCFPATSSCNAGEYGVDDTCSVCPDGTVSDEHAAVKVQECKIASSNCLEGTYGVDDKCSLCPFGMSSSPKAAVKIQECVNMTKIKLCKENWYYGSVEKDCVVCPPGNISEPGAGKIQDCKTGITLCPPGTFGTTTTQCTDCAFGWYSGNHSVKIEECEKVADPCDRENYYGINTTVCQPCKFGHVGKAGAVKPADCHWVNSTCTLNYYGEGTTCTLCPRGQVGKLRAHKKEDCTKLDCGCEAGEYGSTGTAKCLGCLACPWGDISVEKENSKKKDCFSVTADSTCEEGSYGQGSDCTPCPKGSTSKAKSVKKQDCTAKRKKQDTSLPFLAGVGGALLLVLCLFVGTLVRYLVKKRRADRGWKIAFIGDGQDDSTLVVQNAFAGDDD